MIGFIFFLLIAIPIVLFWGGIGFFVLDFATDGLLTIIFKTAPIIVISFIVFLLIKERFDAFIKTTIQEKNKSIKKDISSSRLSFLNELFGLTEIECYAFKFDGINFWFPDFLRFKTSKELKCESFREIRVIKKMVVTIPEVAKLPSHSRWQYQRVDGGPDRRHKDNKLIYATQRNVVMILGKHRNQKLIIYSKPESKDLANAVKKFNVLLETQSSTDFNLQYSRYQSLYNDLIIYKALIQNPMEEKNKLEDIDRSFSSLSYDYKEVDDDLRMRYEGMKQDLKRTGGEIKSYEMKIREIELGLQYIIKDIKDSISDQDHLKNIILKT
jgi:hypothetical protein